MLMGLSATGKKTKLSMFKVCNYQQQDTCKNLEKK